LDDSARQPLFSVIQSRSIYLRMFVRILSPLQSAGQLPDAWCRVSTNNVAYG